jgi:alpha-L-fucosidase
VKQVIHLLVNTAGRNTNLLLNVGPMPNGEIQQEFIDTLAAAGKWLQQYGASVYNTRGKLLLPQPWGVVTRNNKQVYVHIMQQPLSSFILLPGFAETISSVEIMGTGKKLKWSKVPEGVFIYPEYPLQGVIDHVVQVNVK